MLITVSNWLGTWASWIWLAAAIPTFVMALFCAAEGHRTVLASIEEGNVRAPGARLLRFIGTVLALVCALFILAGVVAVTNTNALALSPESLALRRVTTIAALLIVPIVLFPVCWRLWKFLVPK